MLLSLLSQATPTPEALGNWVTQNAFDFLTTGIREFKSNPKYSVIHFCTGVELFMKARLMKEHWSLIVRDTNKADWNDFISGKSATVNLEETFIRLEKIARDKVENKELFIRLASHRNRIIHFHHELNHQQNIDVIASVAREQCIAWLLLAKLLTEQWKEHFHHLQPQIDELDGKMREHREYLKIIYEKDFKSKIDQEIAEGKPYCTCASCTNLSAKQTSILDSPHVLREDCSVCGYSSDLYLSFECECGKEALYAYGGGVCSFCNKEYEIEDVKNIIETSTIGLRNKEIAAIQWEFNCSECSGSHTVIRHEKYFICLNCFEYAESINTCGWCNEGNLGLRDDEEYNSYLLGCSECDGQGGWHAGKDD